MKVHHSRGVYLDGSFKDNGVLPADLPSHISYNKAFRPGRAFFLDGICLHQGYLSKEKCEEIEAELKANPINMKHLTIPYQ